MGRHDVRVGLAVFLCSLLSLSIGGRYSHSNPDERPSSCLVTEHTVVPDSVPRQKPSVLIIKVFATDISKPLASAVAVITSVSTGQAEESPLLNGQLIRQFTRPDEVSILVSAPGYTAVKRKMTIALSPQGNRYEFDAELDPAAINLTVWAVDRQTGKTIPGARFTLTGKTTGSRSITLAPDLTTGLSKIKLPAKGTYVLSSTANGYADFVKSIKLDSLENEARFILAAKPMPVAQKPVSKTIAASELPVVQPIVKKADTAPVTIPVRSVSAINTSPFEGVEKGRPIQLNTIYFDQSSPVLHPQFYTELDQLYEALTRNPSIKIEIRGHTDNQGDFDLNIKLSRDRCQAVIDYLVNKGISKNRLRAAGRGPIDPVSPNNNEENRKKNRRVEFVLF